ncbi:ribokinase-like isoform X2 [Anoplophora glabripennis]|uniref:ribokinase-like isoform X2 n=1 Tax=Anoplophora glabripennis TaxID=217634 RepID=UPI0008759B28|nr:ribokinase-like isoform X2 [Anoplophora glabripennis]
MCSSCKIRRRNCTYSKVGDDVWAKKYIDSLCKDGVKVDYVKETESFSTGIAQIIVSDTGENQIVIVAGANNELSVEDVECVKDVITNAAVVVLQLETSEDVAIKACQLCRGISILNGAPALSKFDLQLLQLPTIFCVNESEATVFTGLPVNNVCEAEAAATKLLFLGCKSVIITLGPLGAIYVNNEDKQFIHIGSPLVKSVDSTGAGDAFIGALAYLLANEKEHGIQKSIQLACIVAADTVTRPGTQTSFPGPEILKCRKQDN